MPIGGRLYEVTIMCDWNRSVIISDVILAIVINTSATLCAGDPISLSTWYPMTCAALGTNIVLQLALPVHGWAQALSGWARQRPWYPLVEVFFENLIFVTCISMTMALIQMDARGGDFLSLWLATYFVLVLIGYGTSLVLWRAFSGNHAMEGMEGRS